MISHESFIKLILDKFPDFETCWQKHIDFWDGEEAGVSNDISQFSFYIVNCLNNMPINERKELFQFIEVCLIEGEEKLQTAIATSFLEYLLNSVSAGKVHASLFVDFLGDESRRYCKAWDDFTGVKTPNL